MKAIILAGGFGTRLRSSVPDLPKSMAPVAGRPFLEYILDQLHKSGIKDVILAVGYRSEVVQNHFGTEYRGIVISYSKELSPLGTGGALAYALRSVQADAYLIINGDTFLDIDFGKLINWYQQQPSQIAMVVKKMSDVARYGVVEVESGEVVGVSEKSHDGAGLINTGVYILDSKVFNLFDFPDQFSLESDMLQPHIGKLRPRAFETNAWFIDIGIPADFYRAQTALPNRALEPLKR